MNILFHLALLDLHLTCKSPLNYTYLPIEDGYQLKQSVIIVRHGARAPFDGYLNITGGEKWNCLVNESSHIYSTPTSIHGRDYKQVYDPATNYYKPSCKKADLTVDGAKMHQELGDFYRQIYVNDLKFLPEKYDPRYIYARSSQPDRCVRSVMSFLNGLYPPNQYIETIPITTGTPSAEFMEPKTQGGCKDMEKMYKKWINSTEYIEKKENAAKYLKQIIADSHLEWDDNQWLWFGDWVYTLYCSINYLPEFNDSIIQVALDALDFYTNGFHRFERGVAGSAIVREVFRLIDATLQGESQNKLSIIGAHDITIVSVMNLFGISYDSIPPFRSHLVFEVLEKNSETYIRLQLNGKILFEPMRYTKLKSESAQFLKYCLEYP